MIKFFRNIRRRLLRENRFTRYLLYAIGEIILVVIGILIALQVNNWNEDRKKLNRRTIITYSLVNDFKKDSLFLNSIILQVERDSTKLKSFEKRLIATSLSYDTIKKIFRYEFPFYVRPDYSFSNTTLISTISDNNDLYPQSLVDSMGILLKLQRDFERTNTITVDKYFDLLNRTSSYPFENYFFDGSRALRDSVWVKTDSVQILADFEQLADWKLAYSRIILMSGRAIQRFTEDLKIRLQKLENN